MKYYLLQNKYSNQNFIISKTTHSSQRDRKIAELLDSRSNGGSLGALISLNTTIIKYYYYSLFDYNIMVTVGHRSINICIVYFINYSIRG